MAAIDPPTLLARLTEALQEASPDAGAGAFRAEAAGALLRVLVASRPGGLFMQLGHGICGLSAWLVDGMDVTSRFIAVVEDPLRAQHARRGLGGDLRIAVHTQDTAEFLDDVSHHRFDLVLVDEAGVAHPVLQRVPRMLKAGGLMVLAGGSDSVLEALCGFDELRFAQLPWAGEMMIAARLEHGLPRSRRGGRRARRGANGRLA